MTKEKTDVKKLALPAYLRRGLEAYRTGDGGDQSYFLRSKWKNQAYAFAPWQFFILEVLPGCDTYSKLASVFKDRYGHDLTQAEVEAVGVTMAEVIEALQVGFCEHGEGRVEMPPKPGVHSQPNAFIHAMPAWVPALGAIGVKWVGGYPENARRGLPTMAEYGLTAAFFFVAAALVFLVPTALVSAELAAGWPKRGGVYVWVK